jgi:hypothetical protein
MTIARLALGRAQGRVDRALPRTRSPATYSRAVLGFRLAFGRGADGSACVPVPHSTRWLTIPLWRAPGRARSAVMSIRKLMGRRARRSPYPQ